MLAIVLFFLIPVGLTSLIKGQLGSSVLFWVVEGVIRTTLFLGYLLLLSRVRDLRRVFEYHGAEHKTISCFEAGLPLTPANAQRFSRLHPRCGTSFLLDRDDRRDLRVRADRAAGVVLADGHAHPRRARDRGDLLRADQVRRAQPQSRLGAPVMWPGLELQLLTTREPDLDQLAVAIAALQAVLERETPGELSAADLVGVEVVA